MLLLLLWILASCLPSSLLNTWFCLPQQWSKDDTDVAVYVVKLPTGHSNELRRYWRSSVDGKLPALLPQHHLMLITIAVNWKCCCWWCGCCKAAYHLRHSYELSCYWWSAVDGKLSALLPQHHSILLTTAVNWRCCCWWCGCCKAAYHLCHSNEIRRYWWSAGCGKLPALLPQHHWRCCCWLWGCWSAAYPPPSTPPDSALPFLSSTPPQGTGFDAFKPNQHRMRSRLYWEYAECGLAFIEKEQSEV